MLHTKKKKYHFEHLRERPLKNYLLLKPKENILKLLCIFNRIFFLKHISMKESRNLLGKKMSSDGKAME